MKFISYWLFFGLVCTVILFYGLIIGLALVLGGAYDKEAIVPQPIQLGMALVIVIVYLSVVYKLQPK